MNFKEKLSFIRSPQDGGFRLCSLPISSLHCYLEFENLFVLESMPNFVFVIAGCILLLGYIQLVFARIWVRWVFQVLRSFFSLLIFCVIFKDQWRTWLLTLFSSDFHFNHLRYLILYLYFSVESSWGKKILACSRSTRGTSNYWCKIFSLWSVFSTQTTLKRQKGTYPINSCWTTKAFTA